MQQLQDLEQIWGVGTVKALDLWSKGYKTIQSLRKATKNSEGILTSNQVIGLKHYEDLKEKIPSKEV